MAATIDATVGGEDSNSYGTLVEFDAWLDERSDAAAATLDAKADDTKNRLLITAADRIDQENYKAVKSDADQAMKFPRDGLYDEDGNSLDNDVIPQRIKNAQFKLALALDSDDLLVDTGLEGFESVRVGPISVEPRHGRTAGELPAEVRRDLRLWLITSRSTVSLVRG